MSHHAAGNQGTRGTCHDTTCAASQDIHGPSIPTMLGLGREKIRGSAEDLHVPFLGSIPMDPKIAAAGDSGRSILVPGSDSPMARAMDEIIIRIAGPGTSDPSPGEEAHLKTSGVEQAGFQI